MKPLVAIVAIVAVVAVLLVLGVLAARRVTDLATREAAVGRAERDLAARLELVRAVLAAAHERDSAADALDASSEQRERDLDLTRLLSPVSDQGYGADWPERRHAALDRAHARADRLSAREDLAALAADYPTDLV